MYLNKMNVNKINIQGIQILLQRDTPCKTNEKKFLLHQRLMVWAIDLTGDSFFTQNNDNLSVLKVNNISLVVLLVKKKKMQVQDMMTTHKSG